MNLRVLKNFLRGVRARANEIFFFFYFNGTFVFYRLSYSVFISILLVSFKKNVVLKLSRPFGGFGSRFGLVLLIL